MGGVYELPPSENSVFPASEAKESEVLALGHHESSSILRSLTADTPKHGFFDTLAPTRPLIPTGLRPQSVHFPLEILVFLFNAPGQP